MGTEVAQVWSCLSRKVDHLVPLCGGCRWGRGDPSLPRGDSGAVERLRFTQDRGASLPELLAPPKWMAEHGDYFNQIFSESDGEHFHLGHYAADAADDGLAGLLRPAPPDRRGDPAGDRDQDVITPPGNFLLMVERIPDAWPVQLQGGGHGVMYQYPGESPSSSPTFRAS